MRCLVCTRRLVDDVKDELHEASKSPTPDLCVHCNTAPKVRISTVISNRR